MLQLMFFAVPLISGMSWNGTKKRRIQAFTDNFVSVGAHIVRVQDLGEAAQFITNKAHELSAKYLIRQNEQVLNDLGLEEQLPDVQISVWNSAPEVDWKAQRLKRISGL